MLSVWSFTFLDILEARYKTRLLNVIEPTELPSKTITTLVLT